MRIHNFSNEHFRQLYIEQTPFPTANCAIDYPGLSTPLFNLLSWACLVSHTHARACQIFQESRGFQGFSFPTPHIKCGFAVWIMALAAREVFFTGLLKETSASALKIISGSEGLGLAMQKDVLPGEEIP